MKKKLKLFASLAILCISIAVFAFGVYSTYGVASYITKGSVEYDVTHVYAKFETRVYKSSRKFQDLASISNVSRNLEKYGFDILNSMDSLGNESFEKVQIKDTQNPSDWSLDNEDYVDTYSSSQTEPYTPLYLELEYSLSKNIFSYFVVTKITNLSEVPLYAYVPTTGQTDVFAAPANSHTYKAAGHKILSTRNSEVYMVFAISLDQMPIGIDSEFNFPINVSTSHEQIPIGATFYIDGAEVDAVTVSQGDTLQDVYDLSLLSPDDLKNTTGWFTDPELTQAADPSMILMEGVNLYAKTATLEALEFETTQTTQTYSSKVRPFYAQAVADVVGTATFTVKDSSLSKTIVIPAYIYSQDGMSAYKVVYGTITNRVEKLYIPSTMEYIDEYQFADCVNLKSINLHSNIVGIGNYAFSGCYNLSSKVCLNGNIEYIGQNAFYGCSSIPSVEISNSQSSLTMGDSAFRYCTGLQTVIFSRDTLLEYVSSYCFADCNSLKYVQIPDNTYFLGNYAFNNCYGLETVSISDNSLLEEIGNYTFEYCSNLKQINLSYCYYVGEYSFAYCYNLQNPDLSNMEGFGSYAFMDCYNLIYVEISEDAEYMGTNVFQNCHKLVRINDKRMNPADSDFPINPYSEYSTNETFKYTLQVEADKYVTLSDGKIKFLISVVDNTVTELNDLDKFGITAIYDYALFANNTIKTVKLPNTISNIGNSAFYWCEQLNTVEIPAGAEIGEEAFADCYRLIQVKDLRDNASTEDFPNNQNMEYITSGEFDGEVCVEGEYLIYKNGEEKYLMGFANNSIAEVKDLSKLNLTGIYQYAFSNNSVLKSIIIPEGVEFIGDGAFEGCYNLQTVKFPTSLSTIGNNSFNSCYMLEEVQIPNGTTQIKESAFAYCESLSKISIPNSVKEIGYRAFYNCYDLSEIEIGSGVEFIGTDAFKNTDFVNNAVLENGAYYLTSVDTRAKYLIKTDSTISSNYEVEYKTQVIYSGAFENNTTLNQVTIPQTVISISEKAFNGCSNLATLNFESSSKLKEIGVRAFNNTNLSQVTMPDSLERISEKAFYNCANLQTINLNANLIEIGLNAFASCGSLANVNFAQQGKLEKIGDYAFYQASALTQISLPSTVNYIGEFAFSESALTSIIIPDGVTTLVSTFKNCESLENVTFGQNSLLTEIGNATFSGCASLSQISIPTTVSVIGDMAFGGCSFKNIQLPTNLTYLGMGAFASCQSLEEIEIPANITEINTGLFALCINLETITFAENANITKIGDYAFLQCESLTQMPFSSTVTHIGAHAFDSCLFTEITISEAVVYVGDGAFNNCYLLKTINWNANITNQLSASSEVFTYAGDEYDEGCIVNFGANVTKVPDYLFGSEQDYVNVTKVNFLGDNVVEIGDGAFGYSSLSEITLPNSLVSIGMGAFIGTSITEITLPDNVVEIGMAAFLQSALENISISETSKLAKIDDFAFALTGIGNIYIPENVTKIGERAFYRSGLQTVTIADNSKLTQIGQYAFAETGITSITIPSNVKFLDPYAFYNCQSLEEAIFEENNRLKVIQNSTFKNCYNLKKVVLPSSLKAIADNAFYTQNNIERLYFYGSPLDLYNLQIGSNNEYLTNCNSVLFNYKYAQVIDGIIYIINEDLGEFSVIGYDEPIETANILEGTKVIAVDAFRDCSTLKTVTIPESVISIGSHAFYYCTALETINFNAKNAQTNNSFYYAGTGSTTLTFGENVEIIPDFSHSEIHTVIFEGDKITTISNGAFQYSSLNNITIPEGVTSIGGSAFYSADLRSITIPESVTQIGSYAFYSTYLRSITIPESVTQIGSYAFNDCMYLETINWNVKRLTGDADDIFEKAGRNSATGIAVTFGENVEEVPDSLFYAYNPSYSPRIKTVEFLGNKVTRIGRSAFFHCSMLTSIIIPESVTTIGNSAFYGCTALQTLNWNAIKLETEITSSSSLFYNVGSNSSTGGIAVIFGENVEEVPDYLFYVSNTSYSPKIKTVEFLGNKVQELYSNTFKYCYSLESIEIPAKVKSIPNEMFSGCSNLKTVIFKEGNELLSIGPSAFYNCSNLTSITIPENVDSIGGSAFYNCSNLTSITIPENVDGIGTNAFYNCNALQEIIWNAKKVRAFKSNSNIFYNAGSASEIGGINVIFGENVKEVPNYLFYISSSSYSPKIKTVTFAENGNLTKIGEYAFYQCSTLQSINITKNVETVGGYAFYSCSALQTIEWNAIKLTTELTSDSCVFGNAGLNSATGGIDVIFGENVEEVPNYLFFGSTSSYRPKLKTIKFLGNNVEYMGIRALSFNSITQIDLPDSLKIIGEYAFTGSYINRITIPASITQLKNAFTDCNDLKFVFNKSSLDLVTGGDLAKDAGLENARIFDLKKLNNPGGIQLIDGVYYTEQGENLIAVCDDSTKENIVLDPRTIEIDPNAFYNSKIKSIQIPEGVKSIGDSAFYNCSALETITIPEGVKSIGDSAFYNCSALETITIPESVTSIGNRAFYNCTALQTINWNAKKLETEITLNSYLFHSAGRNSATGGIAVTFGTNVEEIPDNIFYITSSSYSPKIKTVTFAENGNLIRIGNSAFRYCTELTSITIPESVTSIGNYVFYNCNMLETVNWNAVKIETELTSNNNIFYYLAGSTTNGAIVNFGDNVEEIPDYLFYYNASSIKISQVNIGNNVTKIGKGVFTNSSYYQNNFVDGALYLTSRDGTVKYLISANANISPDYTILDGTKIIADGAFSYITALKRLTINQDLQYIGNEAFNDCSNLIYVINHSGLEINKGQTENGYVAYYAKYVIDINSIQYSEQVEYIKDGDNYIAIGVADKTLQTIVLHENTIKIEKEAFKDCTALESIIIPDNVTYIGESAFSGCTMLANISIGNNVEYIGYNALSNTAVITNPTYTNGAFYLTSKDSTTNYLLKTDSTISVDYTILDNTKVIYNDAFNGNTTINSVTIPSSVLYIGQYAFNNCSSLVSVGQLPNITVLEDYTFYGCSLLNNVTIPASVKTIGQRVFYNNSALQTLIFAENSQLETIKSYAFYASGFANITIPNTVKNIESYAFQSSGLTSITIPESVTSIERYAFSNCSLLQAINFTENCQLTTIKSNTFQFSGITSITIPESVTSIESSAFYNCSALRTINFAENCKLTTIESNTFQSSGLTSITIPEGITSIEENAFSNCSALTSITVPESVTNIGDNTFYGCTALQTLNWNAKNLETKLNTSSNLFYNAGSKLTGSEELTVNFGANVEKVPNCLFYVSSNSYYPRIKTVEFLGNKVISIGSSAFNHCSSLTEITIPESVTIIESSAFSSCSALRTINFAENCQLTTIKRYTFNYSGLISITIPESITSIEENAFSNCSALTSITIPEGVTNIENSAFYNCTVLQTINWNVKNLKTKLKSSSNLFYNAGSKLTGSEELTVNFGANVEEIPEHLFRVSDTTYYPRIKTINFAENSVLKKIGESAFWACDMLQSLTIPESVTKIGDGAFMGCSALTSITISENVTYIGRSAFYNCEILQEINWNAKKLENKLEAGSDLFYRAGYSLTGSEWITVNFGENVEEVPDYLFYASYLLYYPRVKTVTFAENSILTKIGAYAFYYCKELTSITIPESVTSIGSSAFSDCSALRTINFAENCKLTTIEEYTFQSSGITSITIPESITSIGSCALSNCLQLENILISEKITYLGERAFYNNDDLIVNYEGDLDQFKTIVDGDYRLVGGTVNYLCNWERIEYIAPSCHSTGYGKYQKGEEIKEIQFDMIHHDVAREGICLSCYEFLFSVSGNMSFDGSNYVASAYTNSVEFKILKDCTITLHWSGTGTGVFEEVEVSLNEEVLSTEITGEIILTLKEGDTLKYYMYKNTNGQNYKGYVYFTPA